MSSTESDTRCDTSDVTHADTESAVDASQTRLSLALRLVIWYQRTFAGGTPTCRFYPSCSAYAREALEVHGTPRGLWLTTRRLLRCRPFGPSGVDPVPPARAEHAATPADTPGKVR